MTQTKLLYLENAQLKQTDAKVTGITTRKSLTSVQLDQTIFYPQGGGQPSDKGEIRGKNGKLEVSAITYNNGNPLHQGKLIGSLVNGEKIVAKIDWKRRYRNMQLHSAGHLVHEAVHEIYPLLKPEKGQHGIGGELYIEYQGQAEISIPEVNLRIEQLINDDRSIKTYFVTKEELEEKAEFIPDNLPTNKPLRVMEIEGFAPVPDGGTQVQSTKELNGTTVTTIEHEDGKTRVYYQVAAAPKSERATTNTEENILLNSTLQNSLFAIKNNALALISDAKTKEEIEELRIKYLGRKGGVNQLFAKLGTIESNERKAYGQAVNQLKEAIEEALDAKTSESQGESIQKQVDVTEPGTPPEIGHLHLVSQAIQEITSIFEKIGFTRVRYPTVDWEWYPFTALNMEKNHPARDEWETFFIDMPENPKLGQVVLTPHTSNGQVREMERVGMPPIRMLNIARCFRRQQDATHLQAFFQFEGLVVDKEISIANLKGTIDYFAKEFYGEGVISRLRPFHFQFTEPSFEVDFSCANCKGKGCKFCKSGWHEVGGAGMVHPVVLRNGGIDPEEYTGFAFGWGVERSYAMKPGVNIHDIRTLYSTDLRILNQF